MFDPSKKVLDHLRWLPSEADLKQGYYEARGLNGQGIEIRVQLNVPPANIGKALVMEYDRTRDKKLLLRQIVEKADADLLESMRPSDLDWAFNAALFLCAGPEAT